MYFSFNFLLQDETNKDSPYLSCGENGIQQKIGRTPEASIIPSASTNFVAETLWNPLSCMQGEHNDDSSELSLCASPDRGDVAKIGYSLPVEEETEFNGRQQSRLRHNPKQGDWNLWQRTSCL